MLKLISRDVVLFQRSTHSSTHHNFGCKILYKISTSPSKWFIDVDAEQPHYYRYIIKKLLWRSNTFEPHPEPAESFIRITTLRLIFIVREREWFVFNLILKI